MTVASRKFTYQDYLLFPEDGKRHELMDGDHYVTPSPSTKHQRTFGRLFRLLSQHVEETGLGEVLAAPCDVVLSDVDVVQPDVLFVSSARSQIVTEKNIQGAPDLVVEIVSESTRRTDELTKRKLYEKFGVREYWVVDPVVESVKVYRLAEKGYARVGEYERETAASFHSPILPGLDIPLARIFA